MVLRKTKPPKTSPTFEKMNIDRMRQCVEITESAKRTVETSRILTEQARELVENLREKKRRAG